MQHRFIILDFLLPASQHTTEAIHPTVSSLYHPTVRFKISVFHGFRFFFTRLNVRFVIAALQIVFQPLCFIAFIQAEMEPPARPARLKTVKRVSNQLDVMRICPRDNQ